MGSRIFVGGLPYSVTESRLTELFEPHGTVESVRIVTDRESGRSRGFGFVEMASEEQCEAAINALNGSELDGRVLTVNKARPEEPRSQGRGGFSRRGGPGRGGPRGGDRSRGRGRW
jgi:RNA recognition motif-containing protein